MAQTERYRQDEHLLLYHSLSAADKELKGEFDNKKKKSPVTEYFLKSSVITCGCILGLEFLGIGRCIHVKCP